MMFIWAYTRLYYLPKLIYFIAYEAAHRIEYIPAIGRVDIFYYALAIQLSIMCALHAMWFCMFIKMLLRFVGTGKAEDSQNSVEEMASRRKAKTTKVN